MTRIIAIFRPAIVIPDGGTLSQEDFVAVYLDELRQGKFWGVAWDLAALGEAGSSFTVPRGPGSRWT